MTAFGYWLKNIRSGQGVSQDDLGVSIERSKSWVADIERGKARPKVEDLQKISRFLNVSVHDAYQAFLQDLMGVTDSKTDAAPEISAVADIWASMEAKEAPVERVKPRSRKVIEQKADEMAVFLFREAVACHESMPIDQVLYDTNLLKELECKLGYSVSFSKCDEANLFVEASAQRSDGGVEIKLRDDVWRLIEANDGRARFTLAHELGHAILHADVIMAGGVVYRDAACIPSETLQIGMKIYESPEWQANVFASAFLMPSKSVRGWIDYVRCEDPEMVSIASMAEHFSVSYQAARIRMERMLVNVF